MQRHGAFIAGAAQEASESAVSVIVDPSSNEPFAEVARSTPEDVDRAVAAADAGFGVWRRTPVRERRDVLRRIADLVRRDQERLAGIESRNAGKPIAAARWARSVPSPPPSISMQVPSTRCMVERFR